MTTEERTDAPVELHAGETVLTPEHGQDILRPDGMSAWVINMTVAGLGRVDGHGSGFVTRPGDLLLFRPGAIHDYGREPTLRRWTHLWVTFYPRESWYDILRWPEQLPGIGLLHPDSDGTAARLERQFRELIEVGWSQFPARERLSTSLLETLLLWCHTLNPRVTRPDRDPRIEQALAVITQEFHSPLTLDLLARQVGLSVSRLSHLFVEQVGVPPMQVLEGLRLRRACELLVMTNQPIAQIARQAGYHDAAYFSSLFRRRHGQPPSAYRQAGGSMART